MEELLTADEIEDMLMPMMDPQGRGRGGKGGDQRNNPRQTSPRPGRRNDNIYQSAATTDDEMEQDRQDPLLGLGWGWSRPWGRWGGDWGRGWGRRFFDSDDSNDMTSNAGKRNKHLTALGDCHVEYSSTLGYS
jgi:hypothetical protein